MKNKITDIQGDFLNELETPVSDREVPTGINLDITAELRGAVATAMKLAERRGISRDRLVGELNLLLPHMPAKVTLRKINAWMALSKEDTPFPAYVIPAICIATKCDLPLRAMANEIGYELADQRELLAQELGQAELDKAAKARQIRELKQKLGR